MINNVPYYRIINKTKEGVIIENPVAESKQTSLTWEEFDSHLMMDDSKLYCTTKTDTKEVKIAKWISDYTRDNPLIMVTLLRMDPSSAKMEELYSLGKMYDDFNKEFAEVTIVDFVEYLKMFAGTMRYNLNRIGSKI